MNARNLIISIGIFVIILFLLFVFYSKSQWQFIDSSKVVEDKSEHEPGESGQIRFTIIAHNESRFCNNTLDDDADGLIDCTDSDCYDNEVCLNETN